MKYTLTFLLSIAACLAFAGGKRQHPTQDSALNQDIWYRMEKGDYINIKDFFGMTQKDAAKQTGLSVKTLRDVCQRSGIVRWPYQNTKPLPNEPIKRHKGSKKREKPKSIKDACDRIPMELACQAGMSLLPMANLDLSKVEEEEVSADIKNVFEGIDSIDCLSSHHSSPACLPHELDFDFDQWTTHLLDNQGQPY